MHSEDIDVDGDRKLFHCGDTKLLSARGLSCSDLLSPPGRVNAQTASEGSGNFENKNWVSSFIYADRLTDAYCTVQPVRGLVGYVTNTVSERKMEKSLTHHPRAQASVPVPAVVVTIGRVLRIVHVGGHALLIRAVQTNASEESRARGLLCTRRPV